MGWMGWMGSIEQAMMKAQVGQQSQQPIQDALAVHPLPTNEAERRITLQKTDLMAMHLPNPGLDGVRSQAIQKIYDRTVFSEMACL